MTEISDWLAAFAEEQRRPEEVARWAAATADAILLDVEIDLDDLRPLLLEAVEQHWYAFLDRITLPEAGFELVPSAHAIALEVARRRLGLPLMLKIYQRAQEECWEFAVQVVRQAPDDLDHEALLVWFWTKATAWFGSSVEQSVLIHQAEETRIRQRGDARRFEVVSEALTDRSVSPSELSAALGGHPVNIPGHIALVARALTADSIEQLEPALTAVTRRLGRPQYVLVNPGGPQMWAWVALTDAPESVTDTGIDPAAIRVTIGVGGSGLDGFVAAHHDAQAAQRVALAPGRQEPVTAYDDVAALVLVAHDPDAAERFTRATLRGLAHPSHGRLRETVREVLTSADPADRLAERLGVHKNTIRYRVAQAERLLGRPLRERAGDLLLALDYHDAFLRPQL
ncbi:PucR family transcriptional regulator [Nocardioides sp. KC13]|uniref:PucR family transcriptional regulator n=1 Tax=Nocardioides turkmenicus TaxID=2711220 RepID=A0A6M1R0A4_9ACTN|nr:PucR family transcriptional regulator [Nocardioides sp. KC13]NGN91159.1 PucR family transcriptional regulator [Nocardioides sp. KC13]